MMTAAQYVSLVVEPTLEEFRSNNTNLRRGMLASMAVLHVVDFVMQNREAAAGVADKASARAGNDAIEDFKKRAAESLVGFDAVNKFALASKHAALTRWPGFDTDKHMVARPAFFGSMAFGQSFYGDTVGGITIAMGGGAHVNLVRALDASMALYRREFPEAFEVDDVRSDEGPSTSQP